MATQTLCTGYRPELHPTLHNLLTNDTHRIEQTTVSTTHAMPSTVKVPTSRKLSRYAKNSSTGTLHRAASARLGMPKLMGHESGRSNCREADGRNVRGGRIVQLRFEGAVAQARD